MSTEELTKKLREPFPAELVGKLPKINCQACSKAPSKNCNEHRKSKCKVCDNYITERHVHLDYVGHAEVTDRLLTVDPSWTWEPVAFDADGLPVIDRNGGLWIRLTVGGVTRLGYGDAQGKNGPNAVKEAIGDALRNAAMRFGVALDLWAKSDLAAQHAEQEMAKAEEPAPTKNLKKYVKDTLTEQGDQELLKKEWPFHYAADKVPEDEVADFMKTVDSYVGRSAIKALGEDWTPES